MKNKRNVIIGIIILLLLAGVLVGILVISNKDDKLEEEYTRFTFVLGDKVTLDKKVKEKDKVDIYLKSDLFTKEEQNIPLVKNVYVYAYYEDQNPALLYLNVYDDYIFGVLTLLQNDNATFEIKKSNSRKNEEVNTKLKEKLMKIYEPVED